MHFSRTSVFRAAPSVDSEYSFKYIVYGDMGTWGGDASMVTARLAALRATSSHRRAAAWGATANRGSDVGGAAAAARGSSLLTRVGTQSVPAMPSRCICEGDSLILEVLGFNNR